MLKLTKAQQEALDNLVNTFTSFNRGLAKRIGEFYLHKNNGDRDKAWEEIEKVHILHVEENEGEVMIYTSRPGLLIGKRGQNVDALQEFLGKIIHIVERDSVLDWMLAVIPDEESDIDWKYDPQNDPLGD